MFFKLDKTTLDDHAFFNKNYPRFHAGGNHFKECIILAVADARWRPAPTAQTFLNSMQFFFLTIWQNYMWVPPLDGPRPVLWGILDLPLTRVLSNTQYLHKV